MNNKAKLLVVAVVTLSLLLWGCAPAAPIPTEEKIVWRMQDFATAQDYGAVYLHALADGVSERTDGRFEIQIFHAGELGFSAPDYLRALDEGLLDCACVCTPFVAGDFPLFELTNQPFLIENAAEYSLVDDKVRPIIFEKIREEWDVEPFLPIPVRPQNLGLAKPINSMDDFKGLKIRAGSVGQAELWKAAEASPITMPMAEIYTALQRGTVDGVNIAMSLILTMKLYEVTQYVYTVDINAPVMMYVASGKSYNALPVEFQQALHDTADKVVYPFLLADSVKGVEEETIKLREKGCIVQALPPDVEAQLKSLAPPIWEAWANGLSPEIPEAKQLLDAIRTVLQK